ncbi:MAG: adenosylmethionine--8-amino-7-oxononanoate transaminase [Nitrospirae bacterium]|nr:adenosylmethionine--8-amino-7-oxononanoate transaminase [Nitrospirota bacterium]
MNKKTHILADKDREYLWHPFTQMKDWVTESPVIIESGNGVYLTDTNKKRYIDGTSSIWLNIHGHRKKYIDNAIKKQLNKIAHSTLLGLSNIPSIELAEKLITLTHKSGFALDKVFYSDNGSTAVEVGLKMAFQYWQMRGGRYRKKTKFLTLENSYHGDTIGSVSLGGIDLFHKIYKPLLFEGYKAPSPYCYRCPIDNTYPECELECAVKMEEMLSAHHKEIAAVVIEPIIQAAAGMVISPHGYLSKVRELCTKYNVLLIADEVATGFGRTGRMFACEHEDVSPDIMAIAKGITGGYMPLAATLVRQEVYDRFLGEYKEFKTFFHGHSYTGNQLGCSAAIANLEIFEKEDVLNKIQPKIKLLGKLLSILKTHPHVGEIRQKGLIAGIELVKDKNKKTPYPLEQKAGIRVCIEARRMGLLLRPIGNIIILMPPLSINNNQIKKMVTITAEAIKTITEKGNDNFYY